MTIIIALRSIIPLALAHNWRALEGRCTNHTGEAGYCLWDEAGKLCLSVVQPLDDCLGDGLAPASLGWVYKGPNRSSFSCSLDTCVAIDSYSQFRLAGARIRNGVEQYGRMSLGRFHSVMGRLRIETCEPISARE